MSPSAYDPEALSVAIIGAGIAGVCMSIALATRNPKLHITVYEKRPCITELGVGVGIGPNATRALGLIDPELRRQYDKIITFNGQKDRRNLDFDIYAGDGELRGQFLGEMLARDDVPHGGVNRIGLMNVLYSMVPETVDFVFDKRVRDVQRDKYEEDERDAVTISFTDGTEEKVDAVIGCDGIRSRCRELIVGKGSKVARPVFSGRYCYRSVLPMDEAVKAAGPVAQVRRLITGHGRHILMFPVQKGEGLNIAAFVDTRSNMWDEENWLVPASREDVLRDFEGFDDGSIGLLKVCHDHALHDFRISHYITVDSKHVKMGAFRLFRRAHFRGPQRNVLHDGGCCTRIHPTLRCRRRHGHRGCLHFVDAHAARAPQVAQEHPERVPGV